MKQSAGTHRNVGWRSRQQRLQLALRVARSPPGRRQRGSELPHFQLRHCDPLLQILLSALRLQQHQA